MVIQFEQIRSDTANTRQTVTIRSGKTVDVDISTYEKRQCGEIQRCGSQVAIRVHRDVRLVCAASTLVQ